MFLAAAAMCGQTQIDLRTQSKSIDFSAANPTKPMTAGALLPATCTAGQMYLLLNAPPGSNVYACVATNQWSLEGGASPLPPVTGNSGDVLSTDGTSVLWTAPGGDVSGAPGAMAVTGIQGHPVSNLAPSAGQMLVWNPAIQSWQPQTVTGGGAGMSSQLGDFSVTVSNATTLVIGQNCSVASPCGFRFGSSEFSIGAPASIALSAGTGVLYLYAANNGTLVAGSNLTLACTAVCIAQNGVTAFPAGSLPLFTITAANGSWNANGVTDMRGFLSVQSIAAGTGLTAAQQGTATTFATDPSVISLRVVPPAVSASNCAAGTWASDGNFYYLCVSANLWKRTALSTW